MNLMWVLPAGLAAVGIAALAALAGLARRASHEAAALQREMRSFGEHRLAMAEVRDAGAEVSDAVRALRQRRG